MPSPHHPHPHQQCSCSCCSCFSSSTPSPPPFSPSDQLLQALTTQLLLHSQSSSPPHIYSHQSSLKSHNPLYPTHQQPKDQQQQQQQQQQYHSQTHSLLHSLLSRVAALESSAPHLSSPSPPPSSPSPPRSWRASLPPSSSLSSRPSLRDAAARTIQASFRLFLVRRSQTLRYLKCLASIKSHAATLRSSLSDHMACRNPKALSQRATGLLLQLGSIQSGDPMIREGKRSISRELVRILEFVEKVFVKEHDEVTGIRGNGNEGFGEIEMLLRSTKPTKKVSFFENGRESRVSAGASGTFSEHFEEHSNGDHQRGNIERLCREITGIRIPEHSEPEEGVSQLSDDERSSEGGSENGGRYGNGGNFRGQNGNLGGLSAPLPVLMERRRRGQ